MIRCTGGGPERNGFFFFDRRDFLPGCTLFCSEKRRREKISISRLNRYLKLRNIASGSGYLGLLDAGYPVGESLYCIVSHMLLRCLQLGFKGACESGVFSNWQGVQFIDEWDKRDTLNGDVCIQASVAVVPDSHKLFELYCLVEEVRKHRSRNDNCDKQGYEACKLSLKEFGLWFFVCRSVAAILSRF